MLRKRSSHLSLSLSIMLSRASRPGCHFSLTLHVVRSLLPLLLFSVPFRFSLLLYVPGVDNQQGAAKTIAADLTGQRWRGLLTFPRRSSSRLSLVWKAQENLSSQT